MTFGRLLRANLLFHWRGNLAVLLGVAVGCAVLTGALLVGDSLRGSLRALALERLGWVDQVMIGGRFVRAELADGLPADRAAPAILLRGSARDAAGDHLARGVTVSGIDHRFWPADAESFWDGTAEEVVLNRALADSLGAHPGETIRLQFPKASDVPRESLLGRRKTDEVVEEIRLKVRSVLEDGAFGAAFSLQPGTETPRNAFVPLGLLQKQLKQPSRVNAILAGGAKADLQDAFKAKLQPEDWGLKLVSPTGRVDALFARLDRNKDGKLTGSEWYEKAGDGRRPKFAGALAAAIPHADPEVFRHAEFVDYFRKHYPYISLESSQLLIEPSLAAAALAAAEDAKLTAAPTLVYLANTISDGKHDIPYSLVAAVDPALPPPLGPFLPPDVKTLRDDEIALVDWKKSPLRDTEPGTTITLTYYRPEQFGEHKETAAEFKLAGRGRVPLEGVALDPYLTPELPGVTDQVSLQKWDPPFPFENKRVKPDDERYWDDYRTTPKAYVTLKRGQELWGSRFGRLSSIRLAPKGSADLAKAEANFRTSLTKRLDPKPSGLVFQDVKARSLDASSGGTDFAPLLLGFSFFLIAAALLLVALLFRLNLERRAAEVGLWLAVGYPRATVRRLLLAEGALIALVGVLVGLGLALGYAGLLLQFLAAIWPGGVLHSFLRPHFEQSGLSLLIGGGASLLVSLLTIAWALRGLAKVPPRALLAGQAGGDTAAVPGRVRWSWWVAGVSFVGAVALIVVAPLLKDHEARAGSFFGSGALLLTAALAAVSGWMRSARHRPVEGRGAWSVARLGVRNAARHPGRSLLTVGLLAAAAFLLVAVEAFHRHADFDATRKDSGSGGYTLLAESDVPVFQDLNDANVRDDLLDLAERHWLDAKKKDVQGSVERAKQFLKEKDKDKALTVVALRVKSGDDASCLNLYQPMRPRLLGVPDRLIDDGGFTFAATAAPQPDPWKLLLKADDATDAPGGPPLPAFGENNTVVWVLKKGLGGLVEVPSQQTAPQPSPTRELRLVGLLQDSIFQSGLLLSEKNFLTLYPDHEGYTFFLIRCPAGREGEVKELLETALSDHGFEVTRTAARLEQYLAVENTYLTTFQALGGLGLLLGSLGLAVVLLRGVWERRGELALLRALGWRRGTLAWLVLAENGFLLLVGLVAGTLTAVAAVAPHLAGGAGVVPLGRLLGLLGVVLIVSLASAALAVASTLRAPLVPALRRE